MTINSLWRASEIADLFDIEFNTDITGISIDSRTTEPGDLFIALSGDPGPRFGGGKKSAPSTIRDGHDFVEMAIERGAAAIMVHRDLSPSVPAIHVEDTLDGLWALGAAARARCQGKVVAITGSSGKTTMRSWLESLLGTVAATHASEGSFNNHWGVPLSLARMPVESAFGVFEIGTNNPGEIAPLARLVSPDVAVLLNVLPAHIGHFEDMSALKREKLSIDEGLSDSGCFILHSTLSTASTFHRLVSFGLNETADLSARVTQASGHSKLDLSGLGMSGELEVPFTDPERLESVLAAALIVAELDIDVLSLAPQFRQLGLPNGRGNTKKSGDILIIDDSYNANPGSMALALNNLRGRPSSGRRIALLGEMLELGKTTSAAHREMLELCTGIDQIITFGEGFSHLGSHFEHYNDSADFDLEVFARSLTAGDVVLIKGSNKVFWQQGFVDRLLTNLNE